MDEDGHADPPEKTQPTDEQAGIRIARLVVWGMYCPNCGTRIHSSLLAVKGVLEVHVDHTVGMVEAAFNSDLTNIPALIDAVVRAGGDGRHTFGATISHTPLSGMCQRVQNWLGRHAR
jgi:copper chaperone CopZ